MDPLTVFIIPGLAGGVFIAIWLAVVHQRSTAHPTPRQGGILIDAINIAHIPVEGIGGLGLVAGAILTAVLLPSIGLSIAFAVAAGSMLGAGLILWRRKH